MAFESLRHTAEVKTDSVDDNARKFTLDTLHPLYLKDHSAHSYLLTVDWLEMGEDEETKVARKVYDDGTIRTLLIRKRTVDGVRTSIKKPLGDGGDDYEYLRLLEGSLRRIEKRRSEFRYVQGSVIFSLKYDEFKGSPLRMLEVDTNPGEKDIPFDPDQFKLDFKAVLIEVSDDPRYTGYRVAEVR